MSILLLIGLASARKPAPIELPATFQPARIDLRDDDIVVVKRKRARAVVIQYSDWRCPHCQIAFPQVLQAVLARKDVELRFRSYPLSAPCNPVVSGENPPRCELAAAALCADDARRFEQFARRGFEADLHIEWDDAAFQRCLTSDATQTRLRAHVDAGTRAGLRGTPTLYIRVDGGWREAPSSTALVEALR